MQRTIVASDIPPFAFLLDGGRLGRLFDAASATSMADALQDMIMHPADALHFGVLAGNYCRKWHSEESVHEQLHNFLAKVINRRQADRLESL